MDPHIATLGILTLGVGYVMVQAGLSKNALERRKSHRRCPSCGRQIQARVCRTCTTG
jgi:hypothetical protein